jgi:hypothetical protein
MDDIDRNVKIQLQVPGSTSPGLHPRVDEWWEWTQIGFKRIPIPYWLVVAAVGLFALGEQILVYSLRDPTFSELNNRDFARMVTVPIVFVYCMTALHMLKYGAVKQLNKLRRVVKISDDAYHEHVRRIIGIPAWLEWLLLAVSAALVFVLFVVVDITIPTTALESQLPDNPLSATVILIAYTALGWLFLLLFVTSVNLGRGLSQLAQEPIEINVFDPLDRLPFGQLSLLHSLTLVGLILVLILPLGRPTEPLEFFIIGLFSLGSLFALVLPLRGVRRQVERAKNRVLEKVEGEFYEVQTELMMERDLDGETLADLEQRTEVLSDLRERILRSPTWPFRNASATIRAALAAASPILYFLFTEFLRAIITPFIQ